MRLLCAVAALLLTAACSSNDESEPVPASPQAAPSAGVADPTPQGRWRIVVSSDSPYYPGGSSSQELTLRLVCEEDCVGTLETASGVIRTVHWDGTSLRVELPTHESGAAKCFDGRGSPGPGTSTMTVDRSGELVLAGSDPDADGRPTHLAGSYDEDVTVDEQSDDCGFPTTFGGTWSWDLTALDSEPAEGTA
jgi:hypothetical protein